MFDENSVGKKVFSKTYGLGIIDDVSLCYSGPITVSFPAIGNVQKYYTISGSLGINETEQDITLLPEKLGSPDARRIVAMLAWRGRKLRKQYKEYQIVGDSNVFLDAYLKAKQLLIDMNENNLIFLANVEKLQ